MIQRLPDWDRYEGDIFIGKYDAERLFVFCQSHCLVKLLYWLHMQGCQSRGAYLYAADMYKNKEMVYFIWQKEVPSPHFGHICGIFLSYIHECQWIWFHWFFSLCHHNSVISRRLEWNVEWFSRLFQLLLHVALLQLPSEECQRTLLMMISQYWFR